MLRKRIEELVSSSENWRSESGVRRVARARQVEVRLVWGIAVSVAVAVGAAWW
jgi:hypothetical protein